MIEQRAFTVLTTIKPDSMESLRQTLDDIVDNDVEDNPIITYKRLTSIHFSRWVIIDAIDGYPAQLAFSTNYDVPLDDHLNELLRDVGDGLRNIYCHCESFPPNATDDDTRRYMKRHYLPAAAFYIGTRGRGVTQIRNEAELRDRIELFLDQSDLPHTATAADAASIRNAIQQFVRSQPDLAWALTPEPPPTLAWKLRHIGFITLLIAVILAVIVVPIFLMPWYVWPLILGTALGIIVVILRLHEQNDARRDASDAIRLSEGLKSRISALMTREDHVVQNQLTHLVEVRPGFFRQVTLRAVLFAINTLAAYVFNKGELGGIPSIHFARWVLIDGGRRLLFFSNFDGSWENYLGDFIDKAAKGLTAVWSNAKGFPPTRFLAYNGATDEQHFKTWARDCQIVTNVWYSAYKSLTVQNINNNSEIRAQLFQPLDNVAALTWLRRL
jgi:hypothetical protein